MSSDANKNFNTNVIRVAFGFLQVSNQSKLNRGFGLNQNFITTPFGGLFA